MAEAKPRFAGVVSDSQEMILKGGQVNVGEVLSSTTMDCTQVAEAPHWSVAFQVRRMVPVPIQPFICALSWYVMVTLEDVGQVVVAVAVPVLAGMGMTLQEMVMVGGQVMETAPFEMVKGASASKMTCNHVPMLRFWGLDPG
jgi:hypothetical protein